MIRTYQSRDKEDGQNARTDTFALTYNAKNQLVSLSLKASNRYEEKTLTWENDVVTTLVETERNSQGALEKESYKITYGNQTYKGLSPFLTSQISDDFRVYAFYPELVGLKMNRLPIKVEKLDCNNRTEEVQELQYEQDKEGYITRYTVITREPGELTTSTETTVLTWQ